MPDTALIHMTHLFYILIMVLVAGSAILFMIVMSFIAFPVIRSIDDAEEDRKARHAARYKE